MIPEKKITPKLCFALTENGVKLPVLDITHPLFISSIDETALNVLGKESINKLKVLQKTRC